VRSRQAGTIGRALPLNFWKVQNIYYEMLNTVFPEWRRKCEHGEAEAHGWVKTFLQLGRELSIKVD
jgi:hypothetical protein